jgi:hypothetical protein
LESKKGVREFILIISVFPIFIFHGSGHPTIKQIGR